MRKRRITTSVLALVLLIGLSLLLYPTVSDKWNSYHQSKMIISHAENVAKMSQEECDTLRRAAQEFNRMLLSTGGRWDKTTSYKTEYEKLWIEVRSLKMEGKCSVGIENAMRRIIETYFVVMGGMNKRKLIPENFSDDIVDMAIVRSLAKWADEGSHMGAEELFAGNRQDLNEKYLKVFELLFEKLGHKAHYKMMMREA